MNIIFAWSLGGTEVILILAVVLFLFGAKRIPQMAKSLGSTIKEFKKGTREDSEDVQNSANEKHLHQMKTISQADSIAPQSTDTNKV